MTKPTLTDFTSIPIGGEAIPPEGSEFRRAIHMPSSPDELHPWALLRGEGSLTTAEWVDAQYLIASGFTPADRLEMNFEAPPFKPGRDPVRVRISVEYPVGTGVYAWAVVSKLHEMVSDQEVLEELLELLERGGGPARWLFAQANLNGQGE